MQANQENILTNKNDIFNFLVKDQTLNFISKIITNLKDGYYGDKDIDYLEERLEEFVGLAGKMAIGYKPNKRDASGYFLNDFTRAQYIDYFTKLYDFFKNGVE